MAPALLPDKEIRHALEQALASSAFARVSRLSKFLQYVVTEALAGRADHVKETAIAIDVYGRDAEFDPRTNPLVRVDASRLRRRLREYYAEEGRSAVLRIELPKGTYVPRFIKIEDSAPQTDNQPAPARTLRGVPSVAVADFVTSNPDDAFVGRGICEEVRHELSRAADLRIVRMQGAVHGEALQQARASGVEYVITGTVIRSSDRVRVFAELFETRSGGQLWSKRWERSLEPSLLFELQSEIAERTVGNIASPYGVINRDRLRTNDYGKPADLSSYEWTVKFYDYQRDEQSDENERLRQVFEQIVEREPDYAQAWAILSHLELDRWRHRQDPTADREATLAKTYQYASRALSLDPGNSRATVSQACVRAFEKDVAGFVERANRVMEVNPYDSQGIGWLAVHYAMFEHWDTALSYADYAHGLNPSDPSLPDVTHLLHAFINGEYESAWRRTDGFQDVGVEWARVLVMMTAERVGRHDFARSVYEKYLEEHPGADVITELCKWPFSESAVALFQATLDAIRERSDVA